MDGEFQRFNDLGVVAGLRDGTIACTRGERLLPQLMLR